MSIYDEIAVKSHVPYAKMSATLLSTFRGGGVLEHVFAPKSAQEVLRLIAVFQDFGETPVLLGGGSNVLIADGEVKTPVVLTRYLDKIRIANGYAFCECGAKVSAVTRLAREYNLGGLEFLTGVPLTIGGAVNMNASAFGRQIFDFVESVFVFSRACGVQECEYAHICEKERADIDFGYRKGADGIVLGAKLKLESIDKSVSLASAREYLSKRRAKQPLEHSLGSVFKNCDIPAGKLIEECGLKGTQIGGAKISEKHANIIVNTGGATASDYLALVRLCETEVKKQFGIQLEREFKLIQ